MSCPDWLIKTKADRKAIAEGCYYDEEQADRAVKFFETQLFLSKGPNASEPFRLLKWQEFDFIRPLLGWRKPDGNLRFRRSYVQLAKKQGKTKLASGLCAYFLTAFGEESPLVVSAAADRSQASMVYDEIVYCVRKNRKLREALTVTPSRKEIRYSKRNGKYLALSSDAPSKSGLDVSFCVLDELWTHRSPKLYEILFNSGIARTNHLTVIITNAGVDRSSVCYKEFCKAKDVLSGKDDDTTYFPLLYEIPEGYENDLDNPIVWRATNPSLGVVFSEDDMRREWTQAKKTLVDRLRFERERYNRWTSTSDGWIEPNAWDRCRQPFPSLHGAKCWAGLDLSSTNDLTSCVLVFPLDGKFYVKHQSWVPAEACSRRTRLNLKKYEDFRDGGNLTIVPGNGIDYDLIIEYLQECRQKYNLESVTIEKWNNIRISQELAKLKFQVFEFPTSSSFFNAPTRELEKLILEEKIAHDGDALLSWAIQNATLQTDGKGLVRPVKGSEAAKIDPVIGLILALYMARNHDLAPKKAFDVRNFISVI